MNNKISEHVGPTLSIWDNYLEMRINNENEYGLEGKEMRKKEYWLSDVNIK